MLSKDVIILERKVVDGKEHFVGIKTDYRTREICWYVFREKEIIYYNAIPIDMADNKMAMLKDLMFSGMRFILNEKDI